MVRPLHMRGSLRELHEDITKVMNEFGVDFFPDADAVWPNGPEMCPHIVDARSTDSTCLTVTPMMVPPILNWLDEWITEERALMDRPLVFEQFEPGRVYAPGETIVFKIADDTRVV